MSPPVQSITLTNLTADQVPMALFRRHMGLPACAELDERLEALFDQAKTWFLQHGEPWTEARQVSIQRIVGDLIHLEDQQQLRSALLAKGLANLEAHALIVVAVSAGKAVDAEISALWKRGHVDEAMFLNAYAIATVEHLRWQAGDLLRKSLAAAETTVLPHYSPGYDGWDLADQARLFRLFLGQDEASLLPLELLPSGGLVPSKATLAAFGITHRTDFDENLDEYWSCRVAPSSTVRPSSSYAFPEKALAKWSDKRLKVTAQPDNELLARFRFDGSTCTNMGVPLAFDYEVRLKREAAGRHRILSSSCEPAEEHTGYQSMCAYLDKPDRFMTQLQAHQPLVGQILSSSLTWQSPSSPAGCLCTRASQDHKWRIVLQTLHFALEEDE